MNNRYKQTGALIASSLFALTWILNTSYVRTEDVTVDIKLKESELKTVSGILSKNPNAALRPKVLFRYANILFQLADIQANAEPEAARNRYIQSETALTEIVTKFPKFDKATESYLIRAYARERLRKIDEAIADFTVAARGIKDKREVLKIRFKLSNLYIEKKDFRNAMRVLSSIRLPRNHENYYYMLTQKTFVYYSTNNYDEAKETLKQQLLALKGGAVVDGEKEEVSRVLSQTSEAYYRGYEKQQSGFSLPGAQIYFSSFGSSAYYENLAVGFGDYLRGNGKEAEYFQWAEMVYRKSPRSEAAFELQLGLMDFILNRPHEPRYQNVLSTVVKRVVSVVNSKGGKKSEENKKKIQARLGSMQTLLLGKLKTVNDIQTEKNYRNLLSYVYQGLLDVGGVAEGAEIDSYFNLAENNFRLKQFDKAYDQYLKVKVSTAADTTPERRKTAHLRAISSRFEQLRAEGKLPKSINPRIPASEMSVPKPIQEWIELIADYQKKYTDDRSADVFHFESARILYSLPAVRSALTQLESIVQNHPDSKYAEPSVSLIMDTYSQSGKYKEAYDFSKKVLKQPNLVGGPKFKQEVIYAGATAFYKFLELQFNSKRNNVVIGLADDYFTDYPVSSASEAVARLAGNAALAMGNRSKAIQFFSKGAKYSKNADLSTQAVSLQASLKEENFDYLGASAHYSGFLSGRKPASAKMTENDTNQIRAKALFTAWIAGDVPLLKKHLANSSVCTASNRATCEMYEGLYYILLRNQGRRVNVSRLLYPKLRTAIPGEKSIWIALALDQNVGLNWEQRKQLLGQLVQDWPQAPNDVKAALISIISTSIPRTYSSYRDEIRKRSPLALNPNAIRNRANVLKGVDAIGSEISGIAIQAIQAQVLYYQSIFYSDAAKDLERLVPPGLSGEDRIKVVKTIDKLKQPFIAQRDSSAAAALQLANASQISVDQYAEVTAKIEESGYKSTPTPHRSQFPYLGFDAGDFVEFIPISKERKNEKSLEVWKTAFIDAINSKNWAKMAHMAGEGSRLKLYPPEWASLIRGASLILADATSEGMLEVNEFLSSIQVNSRNSEAFRKVLAFSLANATMTFNKTKVISLLALANQNEREFARGDVSGEIALVYLYSAFWADSQLSTGLNSKMSLALEGSPKVFDSSIAQAMVKGDRGIASKKHSKDKKVENELDEEDF